MLIPTTLLLKEVILIYNALAIAKEHSISVKNTYLCIAMRTRLKPVIEAIEEINKEPAEITAYNRQKTQLCIEYSLKDAAGDPILYNKPGTPPKVMSYSIDPVKSAEFQEKIVNLYRNNEELLRTWSNKTEQIQALVNQPATELKPGMLSLLNLSEFKSSMDANALEDLFPILVDDSSEVK